MAVCQYGNMTLWQYDSMAIWKPDSMALSHYGRQALKVPFQKKLEFRDGGLSGTNTHMNIRTNDNFVSTMGYL